MPNGAYTKDLADLICSRMETGMSLRAICRADDVPVTEGLVRYWAREDIDGFRARYEMARESQMDAWADEITEIADDGSNDWQEREARDGRIDRVVDTEHINRSRLRVDTRKWLMSKIAPKKYAEKVQAELTGKDGGPVVLSWLKPEPDK